MPDPVCHYRRAISQQPRRLQWCIVGSSVSQHVKTYRVGTQMPFVIDGKKLYRIGEALSAAPVSRATYFRWLKQRRVPDTQYRDRNGRRLFTEAELEELKHEAQRLVEAPQTRLKFAE